MVKARIVKADGRWVCIYACKVYHAGIAESPALAFEKMRRQFQHCPDPICKTIGDELSNYPPAR